MDTFLLMPRKNLSAKLFVVAYHSEGRCVAVTLDYGNLAYIYYVLVSICHAMIVVSI